MGRADPLDQPACLRRRGEHVGLHRRERLERHDRAGRFEHGHEPGKHLVEMVRGLLVRNAGQQASLFRRPKDEHAAAEISREPGDVAEIRDRPVPHGGIGVRDMKPLRLRQQPVEADAVEPGGGERPTDLCAGGGGNVGDERREREGGDLEAGVATRSRTLAGLRERPVTKRLVADRVAHHTHGSWLMAHGFRSASAEPPDSSRIRSRRNSTGAPSDSRQRNPLAGVQPLPPDTSCPFTQSRTSPSMARM